MRILSTFLALVLRLPNYNRLIEASGLLIANIIGEGSLVRHDRRSSVLHFVSSHVRLY